MMPRPLTPAQRRIGSSPEVALAGGEHVEPYEVKRAVAAYRRAGELRGVAPDAGRKALRIEGWVWLSFCLGMALCALLIAIYEAAGGWWGEAGISVLLALWLTYLAHRVLTEIRETKDRAPGHGGAVEGDAGTEARGKSNDLHRSGM